MCQSAEQTGGSYILSARLLQDHRHRFTASLYNQSRGWMSEGSFRHTPIHMEASSLFLLSIWPSTVELIGAVRLQWATPRTQQPAETQPHTAGAACAQNTLNKSCHLVRWGEHIYSFCTDRNIRWCSNTAEQRMQDFLTAVLSNLSQSETSSKLFLNSESWKGLNPFGSSPVLSLKHNDLTLGYWLCIRRSAKCSESRPRHQAQNEKNQQGNPFFYVSILFFNVHSCSHLTNYFHSKVTTKCCWMSRLI